MAWSAQNWKIMWGNKIYLNWYLDFNFYYIADLFCGKEQLISILNIQLLSLNSGELLLVRFDSYTPYFKTEPPCCSLCSCLSKSLLPKIKHIKKNHATEAAKKFLCKIKYSPANLWLRELRYQDELDNRDLSVNALATNNTNLNTLIHLDTQVKRNSFVTEAWSLWFAWFQNSPALLNQPNTV